LRIPLFLFLIQFLFIVLFIVLFVVLFIVLFDRINITSLSLSLTRSLFGDLWLFDCRVLHSLKLTRASRCCTGLRKLNLGVGGVHKLALGWESELAKQRAMIHAVFKPVQANVSPGGGRR